MKSDWRGVPRHKDGTVHYSYVSRCPYPYIERMIDGKLCTHQGTMFMGKIPCTGRYACYVCNADMMEPHWLSATKRQLMTGMRSMFEEMHCG